MEVAKLTSRGGGGHGRKNKYFRYRCHRTVTMVTSRDLDIRGGGRGATCSKRKHSLNGQFIVWGCMGGSCVFTAPYKSNPGSSTL